MPGSGEQDKAVSKLRLEEISKAHERATGKSKEEAVTRIEEQKQKQNEVMKTVEETLVVLQKFLQTYEKDMRLEVREALHAYVNQLLRIKDSTNISHVRRTCELMLDYVQKQELFMEQEKHVKEDTYIKAEAHELLEQIEKRGLQKEINIVPFLERMEQTPLVAPLGRFLLGMFNTDEDVRALKQEIKKTGHRIWEFIKMYFHKRNPLYRHEINENIAHLRAEKKRLKKELHALIARKRAERMQAAHVTHLRTWEVVGLLIGWLLAFYLTFYFIGFAFVFKDLGLSNVPGALFVHTNTVLKLLLITVFFVHTAGALREYFFETRAASKLVIYPLSFLAYVFFIFNIVL